MSKRTLFLGVFCVILSATCFGTISFFAQIVYQSKVDPVTVLFFRFGIASFCLSILALVQRQSFPIGKNLAKLIALGSIGFVLQSYCFFSSLRLISGSLATVLLYLYPAFVVCISFLKGKTIQSLKIAALILAIIGSYSVISPTIEQEGIKTIEGIFWAVGAALVYAIYVVIGEEVLAQEQAVPSVAIMSASAAIVYGAAGLARGFSLPVNAAGWYALVCIGFICAALAIGLLFQGIKLIGSVNAAILSNWEPVITVIIAVGLLGERLTLERVLGGVLIIFAGIVLVKPDY